MHLPVLHLSVSHLDSSLNCDGLLLLCFRTCTKFSLMEQVTEVSCLENSVLSLFIAGT